MIDRGINELISLMPDDRLVDLTLRRQAQTDWIKWMDLTGRFNLTQKRGQRHQKPQSQHLPKLHSRRVERR